MAATVSIMNEKFRKVAQRVSAVVGSAYTFIFAVLVIIIWGVTGPMFNFSDTWQLIINTGTTIVTFLMVFLIQNTQNRDAKAVHLKLDELIEGIKGASNQYIDLEDLSDEELQKLQDNFAKFRPKIEAHKKNRSLVNRIKDSLTV